VAVIQVASLRDVKYMCHLQRVEANREDSIGFIPRVCYEDEIEGRRHGALLVARENGDEVGFIYATRNRAGVTHIQQVAVQDDARRLEIGTELVDAVVRPTDWLLSLRCRETLPAVEFWRNLGFTLESIDTTPTKRKAHVLRFSKVTGGLWLPKKAR